MASSTQCTQFKSMLIRVADLLTEKNVKDLAFLCNDIKPARAAAITSARDLFAELQGHGLLSEGKVDALIDWLDELRLQEASKHVKEYRQKFFQCSTQHVERCTKHEGHRLKYFCPSCDRKICAECIVQVHAACDFVEIADVYKHICERRAEGNKKLQDMKDKTETTKKLWADKKEFLSKCRENTRKEIQADYFALQEKLDKSKLNLMKTIDEKELSDLKTMIAEREEIERLSNSIASLTIDVNAAPNDSLDGLRRINAAVKQFQKVKEQIEKQELNAKQKAVEISYRKVANDGVFGSVVRCSLVGGVELQDKQLLHVYDERQCSGGVRLICIDPKDISKEYWKHLVPTNDKVSPVVMSYINLYYDNIQHVLFATGKKVFIVHPHWTGFLHDSVAEVSSLVIDEVDERSWITSISSHHPTNDQHDQFLISVSYSSVIREYRVNGESLRKVEARDWMSSVKCVAYVNDIFAVNSLGSNDVILLKDEGNGDVKQSGTLRPPTGLSGPEPVCFIWPGYTWLVLFVNKTNDKIWKVAHYHKTGEFIKVCAEGTICSDVDVPVSITRWENKGFVSFADNSVKIFTY